jgi:hypothetical protein
MFTEIVGCTQKNQEECRVQSMQTVADFELPRMAKRSSQKKVSWHNVQEVLGFMFGASGMRETKDHHQGYPNLTTSCDEKSPDFLEIPGWLPCTNWETGFRKCSKWYNPTGLWTLFDLVTQRDKDSESEVCPQMVAWTRPRGKWRKLAWQGAWHENTQYTRKFICIKGYSYKLCLRQSFPCLGIERTGINVTNEDNTIMYHTREKIEETPTQ